MCNNFFIFYYKNPCIDAYKLFVMIENTLAQKNNIFDL